jgi:hypothetical protein
VHDDGVAQFNGERITQNIVQFTFQ